MLENEVEKLDRETPHTFHIRLAFRVCPNGRIFAQEGFVYLQPMLGDDRQCRILFSPGPALTFNFFLATTRKSVICRLSKPEQRILFADQA